MESELTKKNDADIYINQVKSNLLPP